MILSKFHCSLHDLPDLFTTVVLKPITRCQACEFCKLVQQAGFLSETEYFCSLHQYFVDKYDGCSFGKPGEPGIGAYSYDLELSTDAAVGGLE